MELPHRPAANRLASPRVGEGSSWQSWPFLRTAIWSVCYFGFYFAQQVAELLAPLLLILGLGWAILPHIVQAITTSAATADPQARDVMNHVAGTIPTQMEIAGHLLTPSSLIFDGFLLMAVAAIGATLSALSARNM